ncbi:MAG: hypothetical protein ABTQ32_09730 [Myxococcaceae bacterium]
MGLHVSGMGRVVALVAVTTLCACHERDSQDLACERGIHVELDGAVELVALPDWPDQQVKAGRLADGSERTLRVDSGFLVVERSKFPASTCLQLASTDGRAQFLTVALKPERDPTGATARILRHMREQALSDSAPPPVMKALDDFERAWAIAEPEARGEVDRFMAANGRWFLADVAIEGGQPLLGDCRQLPLFRAGAFPRFLCVTKGLNARLPLALGLSVILVLSAHPLVKLAALAFSLAALWNVFRWLDETVKDAFAPEALSLSPESLEVVDEETSSSATLEVVSLDEAAPRPQLAPVHRSLRRLRDLLVDGLGEAGRVAVAKARVGVEAFGLVADSAGGQFSSWSYRVRIEGGRVFVSSIGHPPSSVETTALIHLDSPSGRVEQRLILRFPAGPDDAGATADAGRPDGGMEPVGADAGAIFRAASGVLGLSANEHGLLLHYGANIEVVRSDGGSLWIPTTTLPGDAEEFVALPDGIAFTAMHQGVERFLRVFTADVSGQHQLTSLTAGSRFGSPVLRPAVLGDRIYGGFQESIGVRGGQVCSVGRPRSARPDCVYVIPSWPVSGNPWAIDAEPDGTFAVSYLLAPETGSSRDQSVLVRGSAFVEAGTDPVLTVGHHGVVTMEDAGIAIRDWAGAKVMFSVTNATQAVIGPHHVAWFIPNTGCLSATRRDGTGSVFRFCRPGLPQRSRGLPSFALDGDDLYFSDGLNVLKRTLP